MHSDSLNRGDVFILDNGSKIWVWCGAESNRSERRKGMEFARDIRDSERSGKARVLLIGEGLFLYILWTSQWYRS